MTKTFNVSTSEVATFLTCKQRWMYAHHPSYNLEPRTLGIALTRGVVGHGALEVFYKTLMLGKSYTDAIATANGWIGKKILEAIQIGDAPKADMIRGLSVVLQDYYSETKWLLSEYKILGVENLVSSPLPGSSDIIFVGRVDLMLEKIRGTDRGEVLPWDHKFSYNFWSENSLKMNPQISNYVWAILEMGMRSRKGIVSMLRYRENAVDSFKQEEVSTNATMRKTFIYNHLKAAEQIVELKLKPELDIEDGITRSASKFNCEYCPFVDLCYTEASGLESTTMRKARFRKNSYGYDNVLDVE